MNAVILLASSVFTLNALEECWTGVPLNNAAEDFLLISSVTILGAFSAVLVEMILDIYGTNPDKIILQFAGYGVMYKVLNIGAKQYLVNTIFIPISTPVLIAHPHVL